MRRNDEEMFEEVPFLGRPAANALSTASLFAIGVDIDALDVPLV